MPSVKRQQDDADTPVQAGKRLPKTVEAARSIIAAAGKEVNAQSLSLIPPAKMNSLATMFRGKMTDEQKTQWGALKDKDARSSWLAQYIIDPEGGIQTGMNKVRCMTEQRSDTTREWLTEEQIGDILKNKEQARILCASGELQKQPHEFKSLADQGIFQYYDRRQKQRDSDVLQDIAEVSTSSDLKHDEFTEVAKDMRNQYGKPPTKKTKPTQKKVETPEEKEFKAARATRSALLRKLKVALDKCSVMVSEDRVLVDRLEATGYPAAMKTFLEANVQQVEDERCKTSGVYAAEVTRQEITKVDDLPDVLASTKQMERCLQVSDQAVATYKKDWQVDIKRMAA